MTIDDLMALNDDELLAALQAALERAEADEVAASARVAKLARAIAAFSTSDDASPQRAKPEPLPPSATPKDAGRSKPPAKRPASASPASRPPKPCCGSLGPRHKASCAALEEAEPPKLAAVPDPAPASTPEPTQPAAGHYECSSCVETFPDVAKLVSHTLDTHNRVPRAAERVPIPA